MGESFELDPVEWITAGALGEPGRRSFYIQAAAGGLTVALLVEKDQVRQLAQLAQELLGRLDVHVTPDDLDTGAQGLREPVVEVWRAGLLSLGMDSEGTRFLLEAEELTDSEPEAGGTPAPGEAGAAGAGTARFWMSRDQLVALAAHSAYAVEAGARERCRLCGRPIDPADGHVCPAQNGHGPLTV